MGLLELQCDTGSREEEDRLAQGIARVARLVLNTVVKVGA